MFWKIVGLIASWIGAFVAVKIFGPRFNPVFVVPASLTLLFVYHRWAKKIRFSEMKRGWMLVVSVLCEIGILTVTCLLLRFLPLSLLPEIMIGLGGAIAAMVVGFLLIYFWWAPKNLYFTFVREGTAKVVVRAHQFHRALMRFKGHILDDEWSVIEAPGRGSRTRKKEGFFGGLIPYGFWPLDDIFIYEFKWAGMTDRGELELHPSEWLDCIFVKDDVYGCEVTKAEDKELMPLDIKLTLTVRIINPYKALFVIENWYETMVNRVRPYVRDFITTDTYTNFTKNPIRIDIGVWERLEKEGILDELVKRYGVDIRKIEVNAIDPVEEFRKATMAKVLALRDKDRIITEARAERERLKTVAQGEKNRIDTVYSAVAAHGELGEKIRGCEALEKSTGEGAKWVIPAEVTRLFSRALPRKQSRSKPRRN